MEDIIKLAQLKRQATGQEKDRVIWGRITADFCFDNTGDYIPKPFTCWELHKQLKDKEPNFSVSYQNLYYHLRKNEEEGYLRSKVVVNENNRKERRFIITAEDWLYIRPGYLKIRQSPPSGRGRWYVDRRVQAQREFDRLLCKTKYGSFF